MSDHRTCCDLTHRLKCMEEKDTEIRRLRTRLAESEAEVASRDAALKYQADAYSGQREVWASAIDEEEPQPPCRWCGQRHRTVPDADCTLRPGKDPEYWRLVHAAPSSTVKEARCDECGHVHAKHRPGHGCVGDSMGCDCPGWRFGCTGGAREGTK